MNKLSDYHYDLPQGLIAQYPVKRGTSRLLKVQRNTGTLINSQFHTIASELKAGDVLVRNNTQVIPARIYGQKTSGGRVECLIERILTEQIALAHIKASKPPKPGTELLLAKVIKVQVKQRCHDLFVLDFDPSQSVLAWLEAYGHIPLPPYIDREDENEDQKRYQTVYAKHPGAIAAPTAGLHFDHALLSQLMAQGVMIADVTLHVGAGTFQPVRVERLEKHVMHQEYLHISHTACDLINQAKARGSKVVAIGTTSVRCLETAADEKGILHPLSTETDLFIRPPYPFKCVDALLTNFHLPQSTLLMLIAAFMGYDLMQQAYQHAIANGYRFLSYGDAMWIA